MTEERQEVYERIPWETLDKQGGDRQWLIIAVAGAIALGALAFSFMRNQPVPVPPSAADAIQVQETAASGGQAEVMPAVPTPTVASPIVAAEADLYAVDSVQLADAAKSHAEWFAVEYFTFDGSEQTRSSLQALMPAGIPLPEAPEGTQVFVDWVGAQTVTPSDPLTFRVEVVVRSLMASGGDAFVRQPARQVAVDVAIGDDGRPRVVRPPEVTLAAASTQIELRLSPLPPELQSQIEVVHGQVLGGEQLADGRWRVIVMTPGVDGVRRPQSVTVP